MLPQVTFRGLSPSSSIVDVVFRKAKKLGVIAPQLEGCHVVIEVSGRGSQRRQEYRVSVHLSGGTIAARRSTRHATNDNVYVALRDVFEATRRQLETRGVRSRGQQAPLEVLH